MVKNVKVDLGGYKLYNYNQHNIYIYTYKRESVTMIFYSKKEKDFLLLLARTGYYCSSYRKHFNIHNNTLINLFENELIEKKNPVIIYGKMMSRYVLTNKGKKVVRNHFATKPYSGKSDQLEHDFVLGKIYLMIEEIERSTWLTETDLSAMYPNEPVVDGVYTSVRNQKVGVEILTDNYSNSMIEERKSFIDKYCDKKIVIHTKELR